MITHNLKPLIAALLVAGSLIGISAHAQSAYVGAGIGTQDYPGTLNGNDTSGSAVSGKIFGGYQFNKNFAVEVGATEFGAVSNATGKIDSYGTFVDAVGILPLDEKWSLLGSMGVAHMSVNTPTGDDGGNGLKIGLGAEYALTKTVSLSGELERYQLTAFDNHSNADQLTIGLKVGF